MRHETKYYMRILIAIIIGIYCMGGAVQAEDSDISFTDVVGEDVFSQKHDDIAPFVALPLVLEELTEQERQELEVLKEEDPEAAKEILHQRITLV